MVKIVSAKRYHLPQINALVTKYGLVPVKPEFINHRDIGVVALDATGKVIGFSWLGLMAGNKLAYSDYTTVDPEHSREQVVRRMFMWQVKQCRKVGVEVIIGLCRQAQYHDRIISACKKFGMKVDPVPYSVTFGAVTELCQDLGVE